MTAREVVGSAAGEVAEIQRRQYFSGASTSAAPSSASTKRASHSVIEVATRSSGSNQLVTCDLADSYRLPVLDVIDQRTSATEYVQLTERATYLWRPQPAPRHCCAGDSPHIPSDGAAGTGGPGPNSEPGGQPQLALDVLLR